LISFKPRLAGLARCSYATQPASGSFRGVSRSVVRNEALAAGGLVVRAELAGLVRRCKRSNHGAIEDALAAEIRAANDRLQPVELVGELCLQAAEGGLRFRLLFCEDSCTMKPSPALSVASGAARAGAGGGAAVRVGVAADASLWGSSETGPLLAGAAFAAAGAWRGALAAGGCATDACAADAAWLVTGLTLMSLPSGRMVTVRIFFGSSNPLAAPATGWDASCPGATGAGSTARGAP